MNWLCSALAYGDFIIDCNFLRRVDCRNNGILAAGYLSSLANAIGYDATIRYFPISDSEIPPPLFNARRASISDMLQSLRQLRIGIRGALEPHDSVTFNLDDVRWRSVIWPSRFRAVRKRSENIYLAYCNHFGLDPAEVRHKQARAIRRITVFPDSRQTAKVIPESTLREVVRLNQDAGIETTIMRVRRPDEEVAADGLPSIRLWGLQSLVDAVRNSDAIVSADSLPSHLSEYFLKPIFVLTPYPNRRLMPLSVHLDDNWTEFSLGAKYLRWLQIART